MSQTKMSHSSHIPGVIILLMVVCLLSASISAQKTMLAASADLDQCQNGTAASPVGCTTNADWVNGNANRNNSHWAESEFLAYRMKFTGLSLATHTVTIGYDILESGLHAIDYLGTFNATELTANPCAGAGCTLASPTSFFAIPEDTVTVTNNINPNTGLPIVQAPGNFWMWGGTITNVQYVPYAGGKERQITVTFTATTANPVLAWGGRIAWIGNWGVGASASSINGSPYHMRLIDLDGSGGNQDRSLKTDAVIPSGAVFIKKMVETNDNTDASLVAFPFTATANFGLTSFSLVDNNVIGPDTQRGAPVTSFGPTNTITVTENPTAGWSISNLSCVESGIADSTTNGGLGPSASIIVQLGEIVTCTFTNTQLVPSAAPVSINGRVTTSGGNGIRGAVITVTNVGTGETRIAITGSFGYYALEELEAGSSYVVSIASKRYNFPMSSVVMTLDDNVSGLDFVATP